MTSPLCERSYDPEDDPWGDKMEERIQREFVPVPGYSRKDDTPAQEPDNEYRDEADSVIDREALEEFESSMQRQVGHLTNEELERVAWAMDFVVLTHRDDLIQFKRDRKTVTVYRSNSTVMMQPTDKKMGSIKRCTLKVFTVFLERVINLTSSGRRSYFEWEEPTTTSKRKRDVEPEKEKPAKKHKRIVWTDSDEEGSPKESRQHSLKRSDRARAPTPEIRKEDKEDKEVKKLKKGLKKLAKEQENENLRQQIKRFLEKSDEKRSRKTRKSESSDSDFAKVNKNYEIRLYNDSFCLGVLEKEEKRRELREPVPVSRQSFMLGRTTPETSFMDLIRRQMVSNKIPAQNFYPTTFFSFSNQDEAMVFRQLLWSSLCIQMIFNMYCNYYKTFCNFKRPFIIDYICK